MATSEQSGLFKYIDSNGNIIVLLPITLAENIDGLDEAIAAAMPDGFVTTAKIADAAVGTEQIDAMSVTTEKLFTGAVTPAKLDRAYAELDGSSKLTASQASADMESKSSSFTLALTNAGHFIQANSTSAITVTIPANASVAFPVDTEIEICQWNTGAVTIAAASGVTLVSLDSAKTVAGQYGCVTLKKLAADTWLLAGALG